MAIKEKPKFNFLSLCSSLDLNLNNEEKGLKTLKEKGLSFLSTLVEYYGNPRKNLEKLGLINIKIYKKNLSEVMNIIGRIEYTYITVIRFSRTLRFFEKDFSPGIVK